MADPKQVPTTPQQAQGAGSVKLIKHETPLKHVFYVDIDDNGQFKEIAIVKDWPNGSISYLDIGLLDEKDRQRLKKIVTGPHADKYELWDLMLMTGIDNGMNALEYFQQITRTKKAPGHVDQLMSSPGSLMTTSGRIGTVPGTDFSNPQSAQLNR